MRVDDDTGADVLGTVLLVEDEILIALEIEDELRRLGFDVRMPRPCTAAAAIALAGQEAPDVAVVDARLGDGSCGFEIVRWLTARGIPCVAMSGHAAADRALAAGARHFVAKPVMPGAIGALVVALYGQAAPAADSGDRDPSDPITI